MRGVAVLQFAVLVIWTATATCGLYLLLRRSAHGRLRSQAAQVTVYPAVLVFAHPLLAVCGLSLWITFVVTGKPGYAWGTFALLAMTAMLGFVMLTRWLTGRGGRHARDAQEDVPARVIALHGAVGLGTFALVLATAFLAGAR